MTFVILIQGKKQFDYNNFTRYKNNIKFELRKNIYLYLFKKK